MKLGLERIATLDLIPSVKTFSLKLPLLEISFILCSMLGCVKETALSGKIARLFLQVTFYRFVVQIKHLFLLLCGPPRLTRGLCNASNVGKYNKKNTVPSSYK